MILRPLLPKTSRLEAWVWRTALRARFLAVFPVFWFVFWLMLPWWLLITLIALGWDWPSDQTPKLVSAAVSLLSVIALIRVSAWAIPAYIAVLSIFFSGDSKFARRRLTEAAHLTEGPP